MGKGRGRVDATTSELETIIKTSLICLSHLSAPSIFSEMCNFKDKMVVAWDVHKNTSIDKKEVIAACQIQHMRKGIAVN